MRSADVEPTIAPEPRAEASADPSAGTSDDVSSLTAPAPSPAGLVAETSDAADGAPTTAEPRPAEHVRVRTDTPAITDDATEPVSAPVLEFGWQEFMAVIAVLALGTYILRGSLERPPPRPSQHDDVTVADRKPVGAGSMLR